MADSVPLFGVFVLLPDQVPGRMDQAVLEVGSVEELHAAIDQALEQGSWRAITVFRGEDIPRALDGAAPTPPAG